MEFSILWLIAAFGGGAFGAAIGPQTAFVFTTLLYLIGLGAGMGASTPEQQEAVNTFMTWGTYGPLFGPHIAFAGGAAGSAYAHYKGFHPNGRDIVTPLPVYERLDVYVVAGVFGMIGYLMNNVFAWIIPAFSTDNGTVLGKGDTIAMSVVGVALLARVCFGKVSKSPFPKPSQGYGWLQLEPGKQWVAHQEKFSHSMWYGFTFGIIFAYIAAVVLRAFPDNVMVTGHITNIGWAISGISLIFITFGHKTPVTHHMTLIAAIGSVVTMRYLVGDGGTGPVPYDFAAATDNHILIATIIGALCGAVAGLLGEVFNRLSNARGDVHIDPPAFAIFPLTALLLGIQTAIM